MLLEAGSALVQSRSWPTAFILLQTDTGAGHVLVKQILGTDIEEDYTWPEMTDRQRGAAVKKALLAGFALSRQLAQGAITADEWNRRMGNKKDPFSYDPQQHVLVAGGEKLRETYRRASEQDKRDIIIASTLKLYVWLWTL
jgi:hypothetical protein